MKNLINFDKLIKNKINIINILNIKLELISYNIKYNLCTKS